MFESLASWAKSLEREVLAVWIAVRDPRTPWHAKAIAAVVAAYAFSPIDLIPDFIPVLGYLDDLVLVPLGIALAVRCIPPALMQECREAAARREGRPVSRFAGSPVRRFAAASVIALWMVGIAGLAAWWVGRA